MPSVNETILSLKGQVATLTAQKVALAVRVTALEAGTGTGPTPDVPMTITGTLTCSTAAGAGFEVGRFLGANQKPTGSPNDGRFVVGDLVGSGSNSYYPLVRGTTAVSAGAIDYTFTDGTDTISVEVTLATPDIVGGITSPNAYAQPGNTRKFYKVEANKPIASIAAGSGANASNVYIPNSAIPNFSVADAALTDGSVQATRSLPLVVTFADGSTATQTVTVTLQTIEAAQVQSQNVSKSFSGASGTPLTTLPGWGVFGQNALNQYTLDGNNHAVFTGSYQDLKFTAFDSGFSAPTAEGTFSVIPRETTGGSGIPIVPIIGSKDANNFIAILVGMNPYDRTFDNSANPNISFEMVKVVNGQATYYIKPTSGPVNQDGNGLWRGPSRIQTRDAEHTFTFRISADGTTLTIIPGWSPADVTTFALDPTILGQLWGLGHGGFGQNDIDALAKVTNVSAKKLLGSLNFVSTTRDANDGPTFVSKLTSTGIVPTKLQHRTRQTGSGNPYGPWIVGETVVSGSDITYTATAAETQIDVQYAKYNDTPEVASTSGIVINNPGATPVRWGWNDQTTTYYRYAMMSADAGKYAAVGDGTNGNFSFTVPQLVGRWVYTLPVGSNITPVNGSGATIVSGNGSGTVVVDHADVGDAYRAFTWSGVCPANPVIKKQGVTAAINPEFVAVYDSDGMRTLNLQSGNQETVTSVRDHMQARGQPNQIYGDQGKTGYYFPDGESTQDIALACNAIRAVRPTFSKLQFVIPVDLTDAGMQEAGITLRDTLDPSIQIVPEFGNENRKFAMYDGVGMRGNQNLAIRGFAAGFYGNGAQPALTVGLIPHPQDPRKPAYTGQNETNTLSPAAAAGSLWLILVGGMGCVVLRAKTNRPAGSSVNPDNVNWEVAFTEGDCALVAERMHCHRNNQLLDIWQTVFGSSFAARVEPCAMTFASDGVSGFDIMRAWRPTLWTRLVHLGCGGYLFDSMKPDGSNVDYSATDFTTAKIDANFRASLPSLATRLRNFTRAVLAAGKRPMLYEAAAQHGAFYSVDRNPANPGNGKQYADTLLAYTQTALAKQLETDWVKMIRQNCAGWVFYFQGIGEIVWSLRVGVRDTNGLRYQGYVAGRDAVL
ncbi:hypothetical protein GGQ80_002103 [Sphingomonas jinjuensis]|uniref:Uncharacterized protein n=1 Tax=Sphingomonas jinjuensis TaxID=535907 RepID=A0A840F4F6_9SPHN|nr:hypothetical protein [Sphingomonas jinjuensis]MBB4154193.1 hypothetical protein [Sphingomonas jinjuensis]